MGLNPFRQQENTTFDIAMVVVALIVTVAVVVWAIFA